MLDKISVEYFQQWLGTPCALKADSGHELTVVISSVDEKPQARMPGARMPFSVSVDSQHPTDFVDGLCDLELGGMKELGQVFVSRVPPLGRDPNLAYYHISFN